MPHAESPKIGIRGLTKRFGSTMALHDIGFDVPRGRKSVLIGPAASGKTVLLKCLAGIYQPDAGSISIDGIQAQELNADERNDLMQRTGVLFQQGGLFDSLRVWENITFKLIYTAGMSRRDARDLAVDKLALVNLPASTADLLPSELSGGMQKRVGIARAIAGDPDLLLLDEPTAGLDPITTAAINRLIDRFIERTGATVLSITSDMDSAISAYDHLFMLNQGSLVWRGACAEVETSGNDYVRQLVHGSAEGPIKMRIKART